MGGSSSIKILREKLPNLPELTELDAYGEKVLNQNDKVEVTLTLVRAAPSGWLDRALEVPVPPATLALDMPDIPGDHVSRGELVRLRTKAVKL